MCNLSIKTDFHAAAPRLREVILTDSSFHSSSPAANVPWHRITLYRGTYVPERHLDILAAMPNLQDGSLRILLADLQHYPPDATVVLTTIILPQLQRLRLDEEYFLMRLTTPVLQVLILDAPRHLNTFPAFIQRSSCQLTKFVLAGYYKGSSSNLLAALRALPALRYLIMEHGLHDTHQDASHAALFHGLTLAGTSDDICPSLISFSLSPFPFSLTLHTPFVTMVDSRFKKHPSSHSSSRLRFQIYNGSCDGPPNHLVAATRDSMLSGKWMTITSDSIGVSDCGSFQLLLSPDTGVFGVCQSFWNLCASNHLQCVQCFNHKKTKLHLDLSLHE
ncbi:hypothetical protein C8R43DRAFT_72702 [Mycena crocata]|nr:hypothetical protein C8R43DRAFT_72702 [Mycena crocata]